jgi:hypothetical protein
VGRESRRNALRRRGVYDPTPREQMRRAGKADRRGRRVGSELSDYQRVGGQGHQRLAEALIARHNLRMEMIQRAPDRYREYVLSCLAPMIPLDGLLLGMGAKPNRPPAAYVGSWADHLAWAVDSSVAAARLLLCGQVVGAACVARNQLERWLMHRAYNAGISQEPGEATIDYVARVWSADDRFHEHYFDVAPESSEPLADDDEEPLSDTEPVSDHAHVRKTNGDEICPAVLYAYTSEIMHGRVLPQAIAWDSEAMLRGMDYPADLIVAIGSITDTITLCLRQVRVAVAGMAAELGNDAAVKMLRKSLDTMSEAEEEGTAEDTSFDVAPSHAFRSPPLSSLAPLLPREGLRPEVVAQLEAGGANYLAVVVEGRKPAGRLYRDDELVTLGFVWHRSRSARAALSALESERRMLGEDFNLDSLTGRGAMWVTLTEIAALVGVWNRQPETSAAASAIASGLRSSYWLWLEDDDRAMSVLRCVLEQVARLRAWRLKPHRAALLEERPATTPRDWLEEAGWRRLTALNRALGEFAHTKATSRWAGARELLAKLHSELEPEEAILVARGASVDFVAHLVAAELHAYVESLAPDLASVLAELYEYVGLDASLNTAAVEERFDRIWAMRREALGESVFIGPGVANLRRP